ncbi:porin family protein [Shimia marina]|uniref:Surface lipoprotein assembly modifier C-terminal domain-containing protein n=1 Tax=Shimia marina TaxID=321267 RepID=A0A0P1EUH2_9RHOB|nr:porin family protein [Shimia marina]CUH54177.1 hypothetical protein SHM7688_03647 [Shimia marina]SFD97100.1 Protein of unknown function [Shimia marina]
MARGFFNKVRSTTTALSISLMTVAIAPFAQASNTATPQVMEIEEAFDYAMFAVHEGKAAAAIPVFEAILAEDPTLVRVRLELARALFMAEQWARSREEFFRVLSGDLPEPVRQKVLAFIRQIDARRGFDWDLSLGFTTAGNSLDYKSERVHFDNPTAPHFDFDRPVERVPAVRLNGTMSLRRQIDGLSSDAVGVMGFTSLSLNALEAKGSQYDDYTLRARFGLRLLTQRTTVSLAPVYSIRFLQGDRYEDRAGLELAFERRSLVGGSAYGRVSYVAVDNARDDGRDGTDFETTLGFRRSVGGRAIVGGEISYQDRRTDDFIPLVKGSKYYTISLYSSVDVGGGWTLQPRVFRRFQDAQETFPNLINNPDAYTTGASLKVERSDIFLPGGYTPFLQVEYERQRSGMDAFSYDSHSVQIGIERRF